jgi:hypothetical protein
MFNQDNVFIAWQSNVFSLVYEKPGTELPGIIYTRYINNDAWLGDFSAGPGRPTDMLIPDVGHFQGVQDRNRAIALYVPRHLNAMDYYTSAKSVIALPRWDKKNDHIWIDNQRVKQYPVTVPDSSVIVIESGDILIGIKPFIIEDLGMGKHIEIREMNDRDQTLAIEMYNYKGPAKTFWELAWPGAFYQGWPTNGWYTEIVNNADFDNAGQFAMEINKGNVVDIVDPRFTYTGSEERKWKVEYSRDGRKLGLEVDLFDWFTPPKRWNGSGMLEYPMLSSNRVIQNRSGLIEVDGTSLNTGKAPAWLYVSKNKQLIIASYHGPEKSGFKLVTDKGSVELPSISRAMVIIEKGRASIDAIDLSGEPILKGIKLNKD